MYERPPVRKSPIWLRHAAILYIRLKLKQDGDVCFGERRTYLVECVCVLLHPRTAALIHSLSTTSL
uniref:Uncharacterized protein n=1 Tax=Triticum urartu TaxID=4572 RepID=A0A8R7PER9_TRIUA